MSAHLTVDAQGLGMYMRFQWRNVVSQCMGHRLWCERNILRDIGCNIKCAICALDR